jgi:iron complex transport system permease protein
MTATMRTLLLGTLLLATLVFAVAVGAAGVPVRTVISVFTGGGDATARAIVLELRLPRALTAILAGGALALSGAVFQALLRNPLAEPYVLGVAGGAAVGAVGGVVFGVSRFAPGAVPLLALAGALGAIALVFRIASRVGRIMDTRVLLLAGVVVAAFFNALILLLLTYADVESFRSAVFWMMGSLSGATWWTVVLLALYLAPATLVLLSLARPFNLIAVGEDTARHLGANVERVKLVGYIVASLAVAVAVATCGVIGFIGLIVPHAVRLAWGSDYRMLLPASFVAGGIFLLIADTAARTVVAPAELPVGVVTALVGVPLFVALLRRSAV